MQAQSRVMDARQPMATTIRTLPTGSARAVTDSVERMRAILDGRAEWSPKPAPARASGRRTWKPEPEPKLLDSEDGAADAAAEADVGDDIKTEERAAGE